MHQNTGWITFLQETSATPKILQFVWLTVELLPSILLLKLNKQYVPEESSPCPNNLSLNLYSTKYRVIHSRSGSKKRVGRTISNLNIHLIVELPQNRMKRSVIWMPQLKEYYPKTNPACKIISCITVNSLSLCYRSLVFVICFSICTVESSLKRLKLHFAV